MAAVLVTLCRRSADHEDRWCAWPCQQHLLLLAALAAQVTETQCAAALMVWSSVMLSWRKVLDRKPGLSSEGWQGPLCAKVGLCIPGCRAAGICNALQDFQSMLNLFNGGARLWLE